MTKLHIYLFRHGQTSYNRDGKFTGIHNPKLTKLGIKQAKTISNKLKNKKFQIAFQTKLIRSKQTLNEVLKFHPECKTIKTDNRMIERNYGLLNGSSHEAFIHNIGQRLIKLEVEGDALGDLSKENREKLEHFLGEEEYKLIHRGYSTPPPKGESFSMIEKRVQSFIKDLIKLMKKEKCNVAISAHGNSIRLFRKIFEKASIKQTVSWFIPYDKVFEYTIDV
jgi:2,3-bisphosphoglycerate-dependent phosphoglycerate mutase